MILVPGIKYRAQSLTIYIDAFVMLLCTPNSVLRTNVAKTLPALSGELFTKFHRRMNVTWNW